MAHGEISEIIPASSAEVFDLLHDYDRRLEWDPLLQAAYLDDRHQKADRGVTSVCVGRRSLGSIPLKTVYVMFERPKLAAVKMVNRPPIFDAWAASIRHEDISDGTSRVIYKYQFTVRPRSFRFFLDLMVDRIFRWETRKRLKALNDYFKKRKD